MILEPVPPFRCRDVAFRAAADWELAAYHQLRRRVFCDEQRLFTGDDLDALDARALVLVALSRTAGVIDDLVGGVRTWEDAPGAWWGGRLVTHPDHRGTAGIATGLIRLAVATAARRGARSFHATVQIQNVPLFLRLGWTQLAAVDVRGAPHALMAADLATALDEPTRDRASLTTPTSAPARRTTSPTWDQASPTWDQASPTPNQASPTPNQASPAPNQAPTWNLASFTPNTSRPTWDQASPTATPNPSRPTWDQPSPILDRTAA